MPYIGKSSDGFGIRERYRYTASGSQTNFTSTDLDGKTLQIDSGSLVDVYLNGVLLDTADYNTDTANQVTLTSGATASDEVMIVVYDVFSLSDAMPKTGGTFTGNISFPDNNKINLGTGNDLILYHDTTNNIIRGTDKPTWIQSDGNVYITKNNATEYMALFYADGAVKLYNNHSLKFETTSTGAKVTGNLEIGTSGAGIDFSATGDLGSSINETLTDYEKGNFTATMTGTSGSAGSVAGNTGTWTYIKIGNFIHINGSIAISNLGSYSGNIQITGLPVTAGSNHGYGLGIGLHNLDGRSDASANFKARVGAGSTTITISKPDTTSVAWSELGTGYLGIGGAYQDFG